MEFPVVEHAPWRPGIPFRRGGAASLRCETSRVYVASGSSLDGLALEIGEIVGGGMRAYWGERHLRRGPLERGQGAGRRLAARQGLGPPCGAGEYGPAAPEAGAACAVTGWLCGNTTTRVPTLTRSNRSETSSLSIPTQPEETNLPIVDG